MQTIWSRIAQTKGACGCPQCFRSLPGVSRRAAASATRQAPKYWTSSTLWYSGIFAAAATFDAGAKKRRREQWDQAIAGVKQELGQTSVASRDSIPASYAHGQPEELGEDVAIKVTVTEQPDHDEPLDITDPFRNVGSRRRKSLWPTNTGPSLRVYRVAPESIYADDERKERAGKRRWTPKKMETVQLSVDMLQLTIFAELRSRGWLAEAASSIPHEYSELMCSLTGETDSAFHGKCDDLRRLWKADFVLTDYVRSKHDVPLCDYHQDDCGSFHYTAHDLNRSLQHLFRQHNRQAIGTPALLAKTAYNLSVSSAPPNIHTYNTLLIGFSNSHTPIVRSVTRSLRQTHIRTNEITHETILRHATRIGDARAFARWVEIMRGKHNGLGLARPDIHINQASSGRLVRKEGEPEKIIQLPYPTPNVFSALVEGVLKFSGFDVALSICQSMAYEGWGLCMTGLAPLLKDCADHGDWISGLAVWEQIQALQRRSRQHRNGRWWSEPVELDNYAAMLRLCSKCNQKDKFDEIWEKASKNRRQSTATLVRAVKAQSRLEAEPVSGVARTEQKHTPRSNTEKTSSDGAHCSPDALGLRHLKEPWPSEDQKNEADADNVSREYGARSTDGNSHQTETKAQGTAGSEAGALSGQRAIPEMSEVSWSAADGFALQRQLHGLLPPSEKLGEYQLRGRQMMSNLASQPDMYES